MRGPEGCRDACADLLVDVVPLKVAGLRDELAVGKATLPDIRNVQSGELAESKVGGLRGAYVEIVTARLMAGMQWVDFDEGYPVYRMRYSLRLYVWTLGDNWPNAIDRRDYATNAVRQVIFEYPTLSTTPGDSGRVLHLDTYTEEYGAPARASNESGRSWAGAMISADIWSEETLAGPAALRPPLGETHDAQLGMTVLGTGEPIPDDLPTPSQFIPGLTEPVTTGGTTDGSQQQQ